MKDKVRETESLLFQISAIAQRYREAEKATGSGFNLLRLLHMGGYEARTHTPILADLLNPQGSHGQGGAFLMLFLQSCLQEYPDLMKRIDKVVVKAEKSIGPVDAEAVSGGIIDILLEFSDGAIVAIENKIYAGEQSNQVARYYDYVKKKAGQKGYLVYLTLSEQMPTSIAEEFKSEIICLTYTSDILKWLRLCYKEAASIPILRESIAIYTNLVCDLTDQSPNQNMTKDLSEKIISSAENLEAYCNLPNERDIKDAVFNKIITQLEGEKEIENLRFSIETTHLHLCDKLFTFCFSHDCWKNFRIAFIFEAKDCGNLDFGFKDGGLTESEREKLFALLNRSFITSPPVDGWLAWQHWMEYRDWDLSNLTDIAFGKFFGELKTKLIELQAIGDDFMQRLAEREAQSNLSEITNSEVQ